MGRGLCACRVLLRTPAAPGRGEELSGDRVKAAVHLILTSVESFLQIPNAMNWRHSLAKHPSADACLRVKDDQHSTSTLLYIVGRKSKIWRQIMQTHSEYTISPSLNSTENIKEKMEGEKIQRKPLVTNLVQWQWVNRTGRKSCSTLKSLLIPGENKDGNRSDGQVFHLRKTH